MVNLKLRFYENNGNIFEDFVVSAYKKTINNLLINIIELRFQIIKENMFLVKMSGKIFN